MKVVSVVPTLLMLRVTATLTVWQITLVRDSDVSILEFQFRYDIDTVLTRYCGIDAVAIYK